MSRGRGIVSIIESLQPAKGLPGVMRNQFIRLCLATLVVFSCVHSLHAQVLYGTLVGTVTDPSGAPVAGANVRVTNTATRDSRTSSTNESGNFSLPAMAAGNYDVSVTKEGFQTFTTRGVNVSVDQVARVNAALSVGAVSESVQVSAQTAMLQADSAEVRGEVTAKALENIPVPVNRNFESLLITIPGISPPENSNSQAANPARGLTFSANGTTRNSNNVRIDGASTNNIWLPYLTAYVPGLEAIDQVSVVTNTFDASQGLAGGAAVNAHVKSGTDQLHGSAFEYNQNNATAAKPFFTLPGQNNPKYINNNFGGTLGGHIIKDKLFYFGSYDGNLFRSYASTFTSVPTAAMRTGDYSASPVPIYDPATGNPDGTGRTAFPGNIVPASRQSAIALKVQQSVPLPNLPGISNNYFATGDFNVNRNTTDGKVDYKPTEKLSLATRIGWLKYNFVNPVAFGDNGPPISSSGGRGGNAYGAVYNSTVSGTYILRPNFVIDGYFSLTRIESDSAPPDLDQNVGLNLGIPGTNGPNRSYGGWPYFNISGFSNFGISTGSSPIDYDDRQYQYALNSTWVKGSHSVRFGGEIDRQGINHAEFATTSAPGEFNFAGGPTSLKGGASPNAYSNYAEFLLGLPTSINKESLPFDNGRLIANMWLYSLYLQDQWQAARKLTVSYGLRWNYFPVGTRNGRGMERYNFQTNQMEICGVAGNPTNCGYSVSWKDFSPNLGLAYRVNDTTVVRAGFGINFDPEPLAFSRDLMTNYPDDQNFTLNGANSYQAATTLAAGIPAIAVPNTSTGFVNVPPGFTIATLDPHIRRDYVESWNFTLEKQLPWSMLARATYSGTRGVAIPQELNVNSGLPGGGAASQPFNALYGNTANLYYITEVNHTHYDGLQTNLSRRFAQGFLLNLAYTFSKNTGYCCNDIADQPPAISLPQYFQLNRSLEPFDRTHVFSASLAAELPFGKGKPFLREGWAAKIAGGWQLNTLVSAYSGRPFSVTTSATALNAPGSTQRADQVKPNVAILGGVGPGQSYFDPLAFAPVNAPRFGTAGYYTLRGPGTFNADLSLFRNFKPMERLTMQVRAEAFNVTNTPHFSAPGASASDLVLNSDGSIKSLGSYTVISSTLGTGREGIDQRVFRAGIRLTF